MKILKILVACFAVLVLSAFFVFELIFPRSVYKSLSAYAEENIASDSVEPLSGDDPDPSIIDYHWDISGFEQYNFNLCNGSQPFVQNIGIYSVNELSGNYSFFVSTSESFLVDQLHFYFQSRTTNNVVYDNLLSNQVYNLSFSADDYNLVSWYDGEITTSFYVMLVKGTYTAETMPPYQPNLKYIFSSAFTDGYQDGYDTGYDSGRNYGYNLGYNSGYDIGYSYGRNSQISEGLFKNPLDVFLQPISNFLNTDIFGSFSIGDGFTIAFFVMIALIFIKMFAGG